MKIFQLDDDLITSIESGDYENFRSQYQAGAYNAISLAGREMSPDILKHYHAALSELHVSYIDFSRCEITDEILPLILETAVNLKISHINLSANALTTHGYKDLFENLKTIKKVTLRFNAITDALLREIVPSILKAPKLTYLDLRNNHLQDEGFCLSAKLLTQLPNLNTLWLKSNLPSAKGLSDFVDIVENSNLFYSDIDKIAWKKDVKEKFKAIIEAHQKPMMDLGVFEKKISSLKINDNSKKLK